jgi:hypothetical protein
MQSVTDVAFQYVVTKGMSKISDSLKMNNEMPTDITYKDAGVNTRLSMTYSNGLISQILNSIISLDIQHRQSIATTGEELAKFEDFFDAKNLRALSLEAFNSNAISSYNHRNKL